VTSPALPAAAAGTWQLGDLTVNRLGLGAMRLTGSVQNRYGFGDRTHDPVLRACAEKGIAFVPFFAVAGTTARRAARGPSRRNCSRWPAATARPSRRYASPGHCTRPRTCAIPGTGSPAHLAENVAAAALRLGDADLSLLNSARP
jgi:aryl-alcohol dehydrogenase-like predicted oxidoreductase